MIFTTTYLGLRGLLATSAGRFRSTPVVNLTVSVAQDSVFSAELVMGTSPSLGATLVSFTFFSFSPEGAFSFSFSTAFTELIFSFREASFSGDFDLGFSVGSWFEEGADSLLAAADVGSFGLVSVTVDGFAIMQLLKLTYDFLAKKNLPSSFGKQPFSIKSITFLPN